ncbi:MAG: type II toxin-antitoxin system RelB/DinJ family antitoxin [Ignavibacteriales bacterium]|nr:type II toxin-antitoxin system RelB/DinJ family antitoxin [Ignavibacteriales bacterium]MCB9219999.1 type II toxin-antitoxin system RelB/DinJ family antitoxin [Ignavibacteriales bacterium]
MAKTETVRAMIDPKRKARVSKILSRLGMNHSEAINIYYSLIEEYKGLPFNIKLPDEKTDEKNISPEVISHLKESVKKNHKLGELLAK